MSKNVSKDSGRKVLSHGSIYLIGSLLQRSVSFAMLPIYTRCLSPADYGVIELLTMVIDFVGIIFGFRISQSIFRYYSKYEGREKDTVISTALFLVLLLNIIGIFFIVLFSKQLATLAFGDTSNSVRVALFAITMIGQGASEIPMISIRASQRPVLFVSISVIKLALQLGLNIYFVVIKGMQIDGVIYSALFSTVLSGLALTTYTLFSKGVSFSASKARELVTYSAPLVLSDIVGFYLTFGDRYFLRLFSGLGEVGVYSLGYKLGFLLVFLVSTPFGSIWDTEKYKVAEKKDCKTIYQDVFLFYSLALIVVSIGISLFSKDFFYLMSAEPFHHAYKVVPIILAAYVTNALARFVNFGIYYSNRTREILYGTILSTVVMTVCLLGLVPTFGAIGAAVAGLCSFFSRMLWVYFRGRKLFDMGIRWRELIGMLCVWGGVLVVTTWVPDSLWPSLLTRSVLFVMALALLGLTPVVPLRVRETLQDELFNLRIKIKKILR